MFGNNRHLFGKQYIVTSNEVLDEIKSYFLKNNNTRRECKKKVLVQSWDRKESFIAITRALNN